MQSKLTYVPKDEINTIEETFQLIKKIEFEELQKRCKRLSGSYKLASAGLINNENTFVNRGLTIKHFAGFVSISGTSLQEIIEAAWIIDIGMSFEENLLKDIS
ncbi:hypothetical protein OQZ33_06970 [Pedobacter sp. MC2016-05]|uniref:hypothetical protein n=1 Tax=Pedobacter sp. MC2016-05 TaxID=2994474 RepID=UPI0022484C55|nr:hypothetical protein [Pedobacter sp. MC2016-05]MCX2474066.1 hypothetical protein [Pedobacter sp. MC2016-05]